MELMEGLNIIKEMCKRKPMACVGCPLDTRCPFYTTPHEWDDSDTEHIVSAAEEWQEKRKPKTMLEVLKERFPFAPMRDDTGMPVHCPMAYFGGGVPMACNRLTGGEPCARCRECWSRPAPEMYQTKEE